MALRLIIEDFEGATTIVPLERDPVTIGREEGNTIQLTEKNVSRAHAKIELVEGGWTVEDLGSYNGVHVNGVPIDAKVSLREGDVLTIGDYSLVLADDVGKKTVDLDRPLRAANGGHGEGDTGPLVASSSQDLPRLSASELQNLAPDPATASVAAAALPAHDEAEEGGNRRGLVVGAVVVLAIALGVGGWAATRGGGVGLADPEAGAVAAAEPAAGDDPLAAGAAGADTAAALEGAGAPQAAPDDTELAAPPTDDSDDSEGSEASADPEASDPADPDPKVEPGEDAAEGDPGASAKDDALAEAAPRSKKKATTAPEPQISPEQADALLSEARKASMAGDTDKAYRLAKQSYGGKRSDDALKVMAVSACKMGSASKAKAAYGKMRSGKAAVEQLCANHGVTL